MAGVVGAGAMVAGLPYLFTLLGPCAASGSAAASRARASERDRTFRMQGLQMGWSM